MRMQSSRSSRISREKSNQAMSYVWSSPAKLLGLSSPGQSRWFRLDVPPCPFCGLPLDPDGHICPRQNGHRRH